MEAMESFSDTVFDVRNLVSLQLGSTSKGNQDKWYDTQQNLFVKGPFYYQNKLWKDYLVEIIASEIGKQLNTFEVNVLQQHPCIIKMLDGTYVHGCYSADFSVDGDFVTFKKLLKELGIQRFTGSLESRFHMIIELYKEYYSVDSTKYLIVMFLIDYLVGNEDRHTNNFGILMTQSGEFKLPPLFDFGIGLFEGELEYQNMCYEEAKRQLISKPFYNNAVENVDCLRGMFPDAFDSILSDLDLSQCIMPNGKASMYLQECATHLGIKLKL